MRWIGWLGLFEVMVGLFMIGSIARRAANAESPLWLPVMALVPGYIWVVAGLRWTGPLGPILLAGLPVIVFHNLRVEWLRRHPDRIRTSADRRLIDETPSWGERLRHPVVSSRRDSAFLMNYRRR